MNPQWIVVGVSLIAQLVVIIEFRALRKMRDKITSAFVRDMASNHLPHIYSALRQLAEAQGLHLEEPPMVKYVDLNGNGHGA